MIQRLWLICNLIENRVGLFHFFDFFHICVRITRKITHFNHAFLLPLLFYQTDRSGRTCFYAQSARRTFGRLQIIITLYHNILRTESDAHQTAGTFFLIQPVNASRILRNHTCIAYFRTFSTLCAHSNMMASILLVGNADAGFHWIRNLVKCL